MIVLDYELLHHENRQTQELDLSTVDSMTILYDLFLGDIIFRVGGTDMSTRWGWVPILDFAVGLYSVTAKLKNSETEILEFTESDAAIDFTLVNGYVKIEPTYAPSNQIPYDELLSQSRRFLRRVLDDFGALFPELRKNSFFVEYRRTVTENSM